MSNTNFLFGDLAIFMNKYRIMNVVEILRDLGLTGEIRLLKNQALTPKGVKAKAQGKEMTKKSYFEPSVWLSVSDHVNILIKQDALDSEHCVALKKGDKVFVVIEDAIVLNV